MIKNHILRVLSNQEEKMSESELQQEVGTTLKTGRVAFFMDFDNIRSGDNITNATFSFIMDELLHFGQVEYAAIYTDVKYIADDPNPSDYNSLTHACLIGFQVIHCPKLNGADKPKDTVDENLAHAVYSLIENRPDIDTYIFATHDKNFIPAMNRAKLRRKHVVLMINGPNGSKHLEEIAHCVIRIAIPVQNKKSTVPFDLNQLLDQPYDNPSQFISAVEKYDFTDYGDLKIALDIIIMISSMTMGRYSFKYYLDWLSGDRRKYEISHHVFCRETVKGILSSLVNHSLLIRQVVEEKTHYTLNREHIIVQTALDPQLFKVIAALFKD